MGPIKCKDCYYHKEESGVRECKLQSTLLKDIQGCNFGSRGQSPAMEKVMKVIDRGKIR